MRFLVRPDYTLLFLMIKHQISYAGLYESHILVLHQGSVEDLSQFYLTNTVSTSSGKSEAGFFKMFFHGPCPHICGPYYTVLLYCVILRLDLY